MANEKRLDLIDRKAMRDALYELDAITMKGVALINQFPAVDAVEVVHGRWIEKQEPITWCEDDVEVFYECSVCETQNYGESPYCPNCGAKMDGGNEDG